MVINTTNLLLRLSIIALAITAIISFYLWGRWTDRKLEAGIAILFLLNILTFHLARLFLITDFSAVFWNNWSLGIHLHAVLGCAIAGVWLARARKQ